MSLWFSWWSVLSSDRYSPCLHCCWLGNWYENWSCTYNRHQNRVSVLFPMSSTLPIEYVLNTRHQYKLYICTHAFLYCVCTVLVWKYKKKNAKSTSSKMYYRVKIIYIYIFCHLWNFCQNCLDWTDQSSPELKISPLQTKTKGHWTELVSFEHL